MILRFLHAMSGFAGRQLLKNQKQEKTMLSDSVMICSKESAGHVVGLGALITDPTRKNGSILIQA